MKVKNVWSYSPCFCRWIYRASAASTTSTTSTGSFFILTYGSCTLAYLGNQENIPMNRKCILWEESQLIMIEENTQCSTPP